MTEDTTWADIAAKYTKYGYTYIVPGVDGAEDETVEYYDADDNKATLTVGEGEDAVIYTLTKLFEQEEVDGVKVDKTEQTYTVVDGKKMYNYTRDDNGEAYTDETAGLDKAVIGGVEVAITAVMQKVRATKVDSADKNIVWGVNSLQSIVDILGPILDPFSDLLRVVFQGMTLTLINNGGEYEPVLTNQYTANDAGGIDVTTEPDDSRDGKEIGNGYLEIRGSNGYEQALVPLLEALGLRTTGEGALLTQEQFNEKTTATQMLTYLVAEIEAVLSNLESAPVGFLAKNLASLVYFIANDGVATLVDSDLRS